MTDATVVPNTGYCYAVSALDGAGNESAKSAQVCIATGAAAPPTPTGLSAEEAPGPRRIILHWTASAGAVSYRIYRNGGTIPILSPTGVPATDTTVAASTLYCYTISAVSSTGSESAQSDAACITTGAAGPPTPTGLTATSIAGPPPRITLTWTTSPAPQAIGSTGMEHSWLSSAGAQAMDTAVVAAIPVLLHHLRRGCLGQRIGPIEPDLRFGEAGRQPPPTPTGLAATTLMYRVRPAGSIWSGTCPPAPSAMRYTGMEHSLHVAYGAAGDRR